jgi:hypothetical protein
MQGSTFHMRNNYLPVIQSLDSITMNENSYAMHTNFFALMLRIRLWKSSANLYAWININKHPCYVLYQILVFTINIVRLKNVGDEDWRTINSLITELSLAISRRSAIRDFCFVRYGLLYRICQLQSDYQIQSIKRSYTILETVWVDSRVETKPNE